MTVIKLSISNLKYVQLFENLAIALNVPFEKNELDNTLTESMQKALDDEKR